MGQSGADDGSSIVKIRGLPWSTTEEDVVEFFSECKIKEGKKGVRMILSHEGRPSGEAYIEMETPEDVELACKRDRDYMGNRYIEVFKANKSEMDWVVERWGQNMEQIKDDACVRLRGLPFDSTVDEIISFFAGLEIVGNGIILATDNSGRTTGEAYVQFVNKETAERALLKHKEKIGHRYIEIFRSSIAEARMAAGPKMRSAFSLNQRHAPYDRNERFGGTNRFNPMMGRNNTRGFRGPGGFTDFDDGPWEPAGPASPWEGSGPGIGGPRGPKPLPPPSLGPPDRGFGGGPAWQPPAHCIRMRGLPFRANQADIAEFFKPVIPVCIRIIYDNSGRPSGEAEVEFSCHDDAVKSMAKDKNHIQQRYIELFLESTPGGAGDRGFGNGFGRSGFGPRGFTDFDDGPWEPAGPASPWEGSGPGIGVPRGPKSLPPPSLGPPDRGFGGGPAWQPPAHCIRMRGLPFRANQADIAEFFKPVIPVCIRILYDDSGRPSGEAEVEFSCHDDAVKSMAKDKNHIQQRYIELFLESTPGGAGDRGFGNGFGGSGFGMGGGGGGFARRF